MKNLLDELEKLDKYDYNVSPDFKDQVMSKIKKRNILRVTKYAISALSCACILGISVFFVSKNPAFKDLMSRVSSKIDYGISNLTNSASDIVYESEMVDGAPTVANLEAEPNSKYDAFANAFKDAGNVSSNMAMSADEEMLAIKDDALDVEEAVSESETRKEQDTYSKLMSKESYMEEIASVLKKNNFKYIKNDNSIIINSTNYNDIYKAIENYVDVTYTISGDKIILDF